MDAVERVRPLLARDVRDEAQLVDGYLDLLGPEEHSSPGFVQNLMESTFVPLVYERWWRPALGRVAKGLFGPGMAEERRIAVERALAFAKNEAISLGGVSIKELIHEGHRM